MNSHSIPTGVEYCLLVHRLTRASYQIDEQLHTFFLPTTAASGLLRQQTYFQTMKIEKYMAPEAEVLEIAGEQGFAGSEGGDNGDSGGGEDIGGGTEGDEW